MDELDNELNELASAMERQSPAPQRLPRPRRDPMALGFGVAFVGLGLLGLLRAAGVDVPAAWLYAAVLVGLGAAGLVSTRLREARGDR
jgi:hypothetical protein